MRAPEKEDIHEVKSLCDHFLVEGHAVLVSSHIGLPGKATSFGVAFLRLSGIDAVEIRDDRQNRHFQGISIYSHFRHDLLMDRLHLFYG